MKKFAHAGFLLFELDQACAFTLDHIFWSATDPAAVINDKIVEIGDSVDGPIVRKIERTYTMVEIDGVEYRLD